MTAAHVHLILNHIPIIGIPFALVFVFQAFRMRHAALKVFALSILTLTCASAVPVYLTGEPAEETVEHLVGTSHIALEEHEDMADYALVLTLLLGISALAALIPTRDATWARRLEKTVIGLGLVTVMALGYIGYLGGKIRRPELRGEKASHLQTPPFPADNEELSD